MQILIVGAYLFIGICLALYMYYDIEGEGGYSLYVFAVCMWPVIILSAIVLWVVDWIIHHVGGGPSMFT